MKKREKMTEDKQITEERKLQTQGGKDTGSNAKSNERRKRGSTEAKKN